MKYQNFATLVTKLKNLVEEGNEYMSEVPSDISAVIFDNAYANTQGLMIDVLMDEAFSPEYREDVYYFLYEPYPHRITYNEKEYVINNIEEYLAYAKECLDFEE